MPSTIPSNLATRDIESLLHPYTNLATFRDTGPLIIERGQGIHLYDTAGQVLYRRHGRAVVHGARLGQRRARRHRGGADAQARLRASVRRQEPRRRDRAGREAQGDRAGPDLEGVLLQFRFGSKRHPDQARLVHEQCARPPAQEEDHQPPQGLSRRHHRRGVAHRTAGQPDRLRRPDRQHPAHRLPASLPLRAGGRERGGVRDAARRRARRADPARGTGHGRGFLRRAGDGGGRRDRSARDLFRQGASRSARSTTSM